MAVKSKLGFAPVFHRAAVTRNALSSLRCTTTTQPSCRGGRAAAAAFSPPTHALLHGCTLGGNGTHHPLRRKRRHRALATDDSPPQHYLVHACKVGGNCSAAPPAGGGRWQPPVPFQRQLPTRGRPGELACVVVVPARFIHSVRAPRGGQPSHSHWAGGGFTAKISTPRPRERYRMGVRKRAGARGAET